MESEESAGGAADSCPAGRPRLRCGTLLLGRARVRSVSCWEAPVHQQPGATAAAASAVLVPMRCGRSSASRHAQQGHASPRAMARDVRNQPAIATRFLS